MPIQIDLGNSSPKTRPASSGPIVGIDLGTTNSLVAFVKNGRAEVLTDDKESLLPSVVSFDEHAQLQCLGMSARKLRATDSLNVLYSFKRLMGRNLADLESERQEIPYSLTEDEHKTQVLIEVAKRKISPIEISAEILRALKLRAEKALGEKVERAVVTVPAYFDDAQRSATKAAGRLAGLEVVRIVNEPTAAALAYGWSRSKPGVVAVFDLGGGTFDVSILRLSDNVFEVLATAGNTHLGGDDFDRALAVHIWKRHRHENGPQNSEDKKIWAQLIVAAETLKIELGLKPQAEYKLPELGQGSLTQKEAQELWAPLIAETLHACEQALTDAKLTVEELDDVLLVGGSTRMPLVQASVATFFKKIPNSSLDPDEAVALGAALQAEILSGRGGNRLLLDVIPLSLGIETMGGVISKLIHRNSTLPTEARELYTNHSEKQTAFDIHVLQGERELVKDCRSLASFKLRGLAPAPAGFHRIEVLFRIDANGILNVRATDLRSKKVHEVEVLPSFGLSEDDLLNMLKSSYDNAEIDMEERQLAEQRIEADTMITATETALNNAGKLLTPQDRSEIQARLIDLKNAKASSHLDQLREHMNQLAEATQELAELQVNQALGSALSGKDVNFLNSPTQTNAKR